MCMMCGKHSKGMLDASSYDENKSNSLVRRLRRKYIEQYAVPNTDIAMVDTFQKEDKWKTSKWRRMPVVGSVLDRLRHFLLEAYAYKLEGAQVVPLQFAQQVVDLNDFIVRRNCACRQVFLNEQEPVCLMLGMLAEAELKHDTDGENGCTVIDQAQAKEILQRSNRDGYVHTVLHCVKPYRYSICNCSYPACFAMKARRQYNWTGWLEKGDYIATVDKSRCEECGTCVSRCAFDAIKVDGGPAEVVEKECMGCGLCTTTCPQRAVQLANRKDREPLALEEDLHECATHSH